MAIKITDIVIVGAIGFGLWEWRKAGHGLLGSILPAAVPAGTTSPAGAAPPTGTAGGTTGALSFDAACANARQILGGMSATWLTASCAQIQALLCGDSSVFAAPNPIRSALAANCPAPPTVGGCPAPPSTAAQVDAALTFMWNSAWNPTLREYYSNIMHDQTIQQRVARWIHDADEPAVYNNCRDAVLVARAYGWTG